jgi:hypothetical protein
VEVNIFHFVTLNFLRLCSIYLQNLFTFSLLLRNPSIAYPFMIRLSSWVLRHKTFDDIVFCQLFYLPAVCNIIIDSKNSKGCLIRGFYTYFLCLCLPYLVSYVVEILFAIGFLLLFRFTICFILCLIYSEISVYRIL